MKKIQIYRLIRNSNIYRNNDEKSYFTIKKKLIQYNINTIILKFISYILMWNRSFLSKSKHFLCKNCQFKTEVPTLRNSQTCISCQDVIFYAADNSIFLLGNITFVILLFRFRLCSLIWRFWDVFFSQNTYSELWVTSRSKLKSKIIFRKIILIS